MKAFPLNSIDEKNFCTNQGMDLRDYFAAKAMQALAVKAITDNQSPEDVAIASYLFADEMILQRNKND